MTNPNKTVFETLGVPEEYRVPLTRSKTASERFLRGPVPWVWLTAAARLSGADKCLHVAMALWHLRGFEPDNPTVRLKPSLLRELGVQKDAARRALLMMERGGLVAVVRRRGCAPEVTILDSKHGGI